MKNSSSKPAQIELKSLFACMLLVHSLAWIEALGSESMVNFFSFAFEMMSDHRGLLLLFELFGTAILFVDMVIRFDFIAKPWRFWHVFGVAFCAISWCFQLFVHFFDSAYLT